MRSIIVDTVRQGAAQRRGGDRDRVTLATNIPDQGRDDARQLEAISDALDELRTRDERLVTIVEMRYFVGLENAEIASTLGISERTVRREWEKARAFLHRELYP